MSLPAVATPSSKDLEAAFAKYQWDEAAQMAYEILASTPKDGSAKVRGAYALFQKGFTNGALLFLKRLSADEWKSIPQGQDKFVEIVSLFQKKVPIDVLPGRVENADLEKVSPFLRDEIRYAKARNAHNQHDYAAAKKLFEAVSQGSRFYPASRYHLATIALRNRDYDTASTEMSKIFEPQVLEQASEFWKDMSTNVSTHWGSSVKVLIDTEPLLKSKLIGELAILAFARIAYAKKNFEQALGFYDKIPPDSMYYSRANYEKIWTLLALDKHELAQAAAAKVSSDLSHFEAVEASPVRALVLADIGRTAEARQELEHFSKIRDQAHEGIERYLRYKTPDMLPSFLKRDLEMEARVRSHLEFQEALKAEIATLQKQDFKLFPVYQQLVLDLDPLLTQSAAEVSRITEAFAKRRLADLERLELQAKLIVGETYLEDREILRSEFRAMKEPTPEKAHEHDERLAKLLRQSTAEIDGAIKLVKKRQVNLEFRQAELLWELSTAMGILAQNGDTKALDEADKLKGRSLKIAEDIAVNHPRFSKHARAMFFAGFGQMELGRTAESERTLEAFVRRYPKHENTPDGLRILGDLRFERNDFASALDFYRRILYFTDTQIIGYSLYKIAWCAYNLKDYAKAMLGLEKAMEWAKSQEGAQLNLTRESRRDLISIYGEIGDARKSFEYFKMVFPEDPRGALMEFGRELDGAGQFEKSAEVYRRLIAMDPQGADNIAYQTSIIRGLYKLRRWDETESEARVLSDRYRTQLQKPREAPSDQKDAKKAPIEVIAEQTIREAALAQHFDFKKSAGPEDVVRIIKLDRHYLSAFSEWPQSQEVSYELGLFLLGKGRPEEAAEQLKDHWTRFKATVKEPAREEALRNTLYALEKVEAKNKEGSRLSPAAADIVAYSTEYNRDYPKQKYARAISGIRGSVLFKYDQIEQGIAETQKILDEKSEDEAAKVAFKNLRYAYYKRKDWKLTYDWATRMLTLPEMRSYTNDLRTIRTEAAFLYAAELEKDPDKAAGEYLRIADDPEMGTVREKALYNAFVQKEKAGKKAEALEISARLQKMSPKFEGLKGASGIRAALYQEAGDYERAFPLLRDLIRNPGAEGTPEVLQQARLNAGLIAEAEESSEVANGYYRKYLEESKKVSSPGLEEAKRGLQRLSAHGTRAPAAAPAKWDELQKGRADFEKAPLPKSKDLAERIKKGAERLESLSKQLLQISSSKSVDSKFAYEAYCSVPFLYDAYADGVMKMKMPDGSAAPAELMTELQKIAAPIQEKGAALAEECLKRAADAEHDGKFFRRVNEKWGWMKEKDRRDKVAKVVELLAQGTPWLEAAPLSLPEEELLKLHLEKGATPDSWYTLALRRLERKKPGLSRLTLLDALSKQPGTGRILNVLAYLASLKSDTSNLTSLYDQAGAAGSTAAWANLALLHLKGARLAQAAPALRQALDSRVFDGNEELKKLVKEVIE